MKKVTFHLARHTFTTLFLSKGVPLENLSKMMVRKKHCHYTDLRLGIQRKS